MFINVMLIKKHVVYSSFYSTNWYQYFGDDFKQVLDRACIQKRFSKLSRNLCMW